MFPKTRADHWRLVAWLGQHGPVERVGSEGSANLGAGVARLLADTGLDVREVPCALTVREHVAALNPATGVGRPARAMVAARASGVITSRNHRAGMSPPVR